MSVGPGTLSEPVLELNAISKRYGDRAANNAIDFTLQRGEVHALLGENGAGKTTLMKIVFGLVTPDSGTIKVRGRDTRIRDPRHAAELGIGMVHQHFMLVPDMTVAENVVIGLRRNGSPVLDLRAVGRELATLSNRYGLDLEPAALIEDLSVGMRQRVEILKLLYRGTEIIVLDEPTAVLTEGEWDRLQGIIRGWASEERSVIFISHKLRETIAVADRCTVLRDGAVVRTFERGDMREGELARSMVGRPVVLRVPHVDVEPGDVVFKASGLRLRDATGASLLKDISFAVRAGEVLGVAGVDGNGQTELFEVLTGVRPLTAGEVRIADDRVDGAGARRYVGLRGALIPPDRHADGLALGMSVRDNLIVGDLWTGSFTRNGMLHAGRIRRHCEALVDSFGISAPGLQAPVRELSGGNQQKILLARSIHRLPVVLVASQPTRGLDVGAMQFVYEQILALKQQRCAIVLISTDLEELLSLCDRLAVLVRGSFASIVDAKRADPHAIGMLMGGANSAAVA